jgi:hypothetical protein
LLEWGCVRRFSLHVGLLILLLALAARPAHADAVSDAQARVLKLENETAQLDGRRLRLEYDANSLAAEIERVKAEPTGVRRDFRLRELLASSKAKADELTRIAAELRWHVGPLGDARRELLTTCDRALAAPSLNEARRLELARVRTAQAALLATPAAPMGSIKVTAPVSVDPLDGPRELKEKADLLRDSEDKLKREVQRLAGRIDDVERRRHLRERVGAVDDDMFGEAVSNRRFARINNGLSSISHDNGKSSGSDTTTQNPAPMSGGTPTMGATTGSSTGGTSGSIGGTTGGVGLGGTTGGGSPPSNGTSGTSGGGGNSFTNTPAGTSNDPGGGRSTDSTVLRNLVDPSTLDELRRADGGDDLERQVRALRRAQGELEGMAAELERRARSLNHRADELKKQK